MCYFANSLVIAIIASVLAFRLAVTDPTRSPPFCFLEAFFCSRNR
ncbi:photosystem I reaction center subunit XII [Chryseobacterium sp. RP-3-3]|uniref:Photosystem I reaction center subunit XII n=1 Tax=Chryseobacterium antibioticum TaxID=2728847 RepID=A0A7Y0AME6_9FLAO|nr:photosystem I reaction center subunit XII [Chryseobacterium antibioticum]